MAINSVRNRRNHNGLSAETVVQTFKFTTNVPITPFSPTVGRRGKPFKDVVTNEKYYNYFVPQSSAPLPDGFVLNSRTGEISGTPTTSTIVDALNFSVSVIIAVKDSLNHTAYKHSIVDFVVVDPFVVQEKALSYNAKVNKITIDDTLFTSVTGGRPPYVYTITQGTLPTGVKINQTTGKLSGKPTVVKRTYLDPSEVGELPLEDPITVTVTDFYNTVVTNITTVNFNIEDVIIAVPNPNVPVKGNTPLTVFFTGFSSVTLGTEPYIYILPESQKDPLPEGVTLNPETGVLSGSYNGSTEYKGKIQIAVSDQDGNIASKVAEVDIEAYIKLSAVAKHVDNAGAAVTSFTFVATKPIKHTPLKALYGAEPYIFTLWYCTYIDKYESLVHYDDGIPGVIINETTGEFSATNGLPAGTYIFGLKVSDSLGTLIDTAPSIFYNVSDKIYATIFTETPVYKLYVGDQSSKLVNGELILRAESGVPPYTFKVTPALPDGLAFDNTSNLCIVKGSPTAPGKTTCVFKVKDSTDTEADTTYTIEFNVANRLTTSADNIEIVRVLGEKAATVKIFDKIEGGYPPYSCALMFGQLPYEYTFKGDDFSYIDGAGATVAVHEPQLWGNSWTDNPNSPSIKGPIKIHHELGTYVSYYQLSDSLGSVSENRSRVQFTIVRGLSGTSNNVPTITGLAKVTHVSFKPCSADGGTPPYRINIASTIVDPDTDETIKIPQLGLLKYQPDTIFGVPDIGYVGKQYFYISDSKGCKTPNFPVEFEITGEFKATLFNPPPTVVCVQGTDLYQLYHVPTGGTVGMLEVLQNLDEPVFKSVTGGVPPYRYFLSDKDGNNVKAANKLPAHFFIDEKTGRISGKASLAETYLSSTFYVTAADSNNTKSKPSQFTLRINRPMITEQFDNVGTGNITFESADRTKSNSLLRKVVGDLMMRFKISEAKYGSGRYEYSLRAETGANIFYSNFKMDPSNGDITVLYGATLLAPGHMKLAVNVKDLFTGIVIQAPDVLEFTIYPKINLTLNPLYAPVLRLFRGKVITTDNINPIIISGGSGNYVVTTVPELPNGLAIDSNGMLMDAPIPLTPENLYVMRVDDAEFTGSHQLMSFKLVVQTIYVTIDVDAGPNKAYNMGTLQALTNLSQADIFNVPIVITMNILGTVYSVNPTQPALSIEFGGVHTDTTLLIDIKGGDGIFGAGGIGGTPSASDKLSRNGKPGGTAVKINMANAAVTIKGNGKIIGGGGGGGGAGGQDWMQLGTMQAYRYLMHYSVTIDKKTRKNMDASYDTMIDGTNQAIANAMVWTSYSNSSDSTTITKISKIEFLPSVLATVKPQPAGKLKPASTQIGSGGGRGAGGDSQGKVPGQPGSKSPKSSSSATKATPAGVPDDAKFDKLEQWADKVTLYDGSIVKIPAWSSSMPYAGDANYGSRDWASGGEGPFAGSAEFDIMSGEGMLYGPGGGGGGGFGSKGGNGGYASSPPPSSPTAKPKDFPAGVGGDGGLAIDASDCFIPPEIHPSTIVYGDVKQYVEPPDPTAPI